MNPKELKDLERIMTLASKWSNEDIQNEKDSLYANILSACELIKTELGKAS